MSPTRRLRGLLRQPFARFGLALLPIGLGIGMHNLTRGVHVQAQVSGGQQVPAIDPRLVLHPQTVLVRGELPDGIQISGSLYPGLPGPNTLRLTMRSDTGVRPTGDPIRIVASMPGMRMVPALSRLVAIHATYTGSLWLPMFGSYSATASIPTSSGIITGSIRLTVPYTPAPVQ